MVIPSVSSFLKRGNHKTTAEICGKRINRGAGLGLENPGRAYSWQRDCKKAIKRKI